jgi:hypothetical protein
MSEIRVDSEEKALRLLQDAMDGRYENKDVQLVFDNWPIIEIKLKGKGYDSTITPDVAEALLQVQDALNRSFALIVRNKPNARELSREDRQSIKFKAKVKKSSSLFEINLGDYAQRVSSELVARMSPEQLMITVIGLAVVAGSTIAFRAWLKHQSDNKKLDAEAKQRIALSEQDTQRLEIVTRVLKQQPKLRHAREEFDEARLDMVRSIGDADSIEVNGEELSSAEAYEIGLTTRSRSKDIQLNGHYRIEKIDWQHGEQDVRLSLQSEDGKQEFWASLNQESITPEHKDILKEAEWGRKAIYMSINAGTKRGEVTRARIVSVSWPRRPRAA